MPEAVCDSQKSRVERNVLGRLLTLTCIHVFFFFYTLDNIERVRLAIEGDRRLTVGELENDLGIPKTTVWEILNKILVMTRVCAVTGFFTTITRQRIHRILCSSF